MTAHRRRQILTGRPGSASPPGISPSVEAVIRSLEGPFITTAELAASGDVAASWWDSYYDVRWDILWDYDTATTSPPSFIPGCGARWDAPNSTAYYEQGAREFVQWVRTGGTQKHYDRARACNANIRDTYIIPNDYGPGVHWMALHGLTLDWFVAGDTRSRDTVINTANRMLPTFDTYAVNFASPDVEPRIWGRILDCAWMWEKINGTPMLRGDGQAYIDELIPQFLAVQNGAGYWPLPSYCYASDNWIQAHFLNYLIKFYDDRPGAYNASILAAATAFANYIWNSQWFGTPDFAFAFISAPCVSTSTNTGPARDLNAFFLPLFGWLGKHVDPVWWSRADLLLTGIKLNADDSPTSYLSLGGPVRYKQFTEVWSPFVYRYFGYRYGS